MASIPTQEEILEATRKSQEAMIAALKSWLETVRTATPKLTAMYAPLTDKLPKLPPVSLPFADKLPTPEEAVASAYHTVEQLLASQRKFTEELLKAMTPLIPSRGESLAKAEAPSRSAWQEAVTASEPKTVASTAPAAAPARPQAKTTPATSTPATSTPTTPAPRTAAAKRSTGTSTAAKTGTSTAAKTGTSTAAKTGTSTAAKTGTSTAAKQAKANPAAKDADAS
jgi:hypothetical protein